MRSGLFLDHEVPGALDDPEFDAERSVHGGPEPSRRQEHIMLAGHDATGDGSARHAGKRRGAAGPGVAGDERHPVDQRGAGRGAGQCDRRAEGVPQHDHRP